ncbi:MAG: DNA-binding domain-containing protein [Pseudomonadota bacterium]
MSDLSLAELQSTLQQYLLDQQGNIDTLTLETAAFTRQQRLGIYYDAYRLRLIDALRKDFPALELSLGSDIFAQLITEYIAKHPSQHASLRWLGEKLPIFLRAHSTWQQHINIIELAEFEWAQIMAFDGEDSIPATLDNLRNLENAQWIDLQLKFQPSLQIVNHFSNATSVWSGLIKDATQIATEFFVENQTWVIWRSELQVLYRPLDKPEAWCLEAFSNNQNFSDICGGLCEWFPEEQVPLKAVQYLQQWLEGGIIKSLIVSQS